MREYQVISTDDHIIEPPGIFDSRLPKEFEDRTPKLVETDDEAAWHVPGIERPIAMSGLSSAAGQKETEFSPKSKTFDAMRAGCYDPSERLKDMDLDGVDAQVCFPTLPGLAGIAFVEIAEKPWAQALIRAYNDWLVEEWCAPALQDRRPTAFGVRIESSTEPPARGATRPRVPAAPAAQPA